MAIRIRPSIILFGDSITQEGFGVENSIGWASLLSNAYTRRADVLNRGFSGYNTRHALGIFDSVFAASSRGNDGRALFCTFFFGANDASVEGERQHVPVDEYTTNVKDMVMKIRQRLDIPVILMTPPPVSPTAWDKYCLDTFNERRSTRSNTLAHQYGNAVKSVGAELGMSVVDSWSLLKGDTEEGVYGRYLRDGLHLSGEGNRILFEGLMEVIGKDFPDLVPMEDGDGKYGEKGVAMEEKLWKELC